MHAGIDVGSSLTKVVWKAQDYQFATTADKPLEVILEELRADNVKELYAAGIGSIPEQKDFIVYKTTKDVIANEILLQAKGAGVLLQRQGIFLDDFLLVSLGTGVSYTSVRKGEKTYDSLGVEEVQHFPLGSAIGGGFIQGLSKIINQRDSGVQSLENTYAPLDLLVQDKLPEKIGTFEGSLVIAHFGKANENSHKEDVYKSIVHCVAVSTVRDVLLVGMVKDFPQHNHVVYVGSTVARNPSLQVLLQSYTQAIGKIPHFVDKGEFSLAMGAYLEAENKDKAVTFKNK